MHHLSWLAILAAAVAAMVLGTVYYMALGKQLAPLHPAYADPNAKPEPWKIGVELVRCFVLAFVIAFLVYITDTDGAGSAVHLALLLWTGFPLVLWLGAMTWERVPPELAGIHLGDWLIKLVVVTLIVTLWR